MGLLTAKSNILAPKVKVTAWTLRLKSGEIRRNRAGLGEINGIKGNQISLVLLISDFAVFDQLDQQNGQT